MATTVLEAPRYTQLNVRVYQHNGSLLAALEVPIDPRDRYVSAEMLYRYCSSIFIFPDENEWAIFRLRANTTPGATLRPSGRSLVDPGNYMVLEKNQNPTTVDLTTNCAPRRVTTPDTHTQSQGQGERDHLQAKFRNTLRQRDNCCVITGQTRATTYERPFLGLDATHIFPVSMLSEWRAGGYRQYITDTRPDSEIGESRLYSAQNGLLLSADIHAQFNDFQLGIDPDSDHKIIVFGADPAKMGGTRLRSSARNGIDGVCPELLRWHLRMCLYKSLKVNADPQTIWEEDLGENPMGSILEQPDAAERMEVELFTRLGSFVA
ncbi:uncharacterized protein N7500_005546 [Penicillium coprophilum]|uniref:uncharacterized protein n=1 Tax=Penicillium coprophilum TaxID=36646 RepID=UPI00238B3BEC|nr:uncharacterized protein N7500_005546 [Penicillium coprophilum]KAJ5163716.1 hypothetical protein N7500_005546 [Penicillium coprophilum]